MNDITSGSSIDLTEITENQQEIIENQQDLLKEIQEYRKYIEDKDIQQLEASTVSDSSITFQTEQKEYMTVSTVLLIILAFCVFFGVGINLANIFWGRINLG